MSFDAENRRAQNGNAVGGAEGAIRAASTRRDGANAVADLRAGLGPGPFALVLTFVSERRDREAFARALDGAFGDAPVIGACTPGEIGPDGAVTGSITALALPASGFSASVRLVEKLPSFRRTEGEAMARSMLGELARDAGERRPNRFGVMLSDAAAMREEALAFAFGGGLEGAPLVGGSCAPGDGVGQGFVLADGRFCASSAAVAYLATDMGLEALRIDHYEATETRAVITACDADDRTVRELNGEPAAEEYARLAGLDLASLGPSAFAAHPLVVSVSGTTHARGIRAALDDGALTFSAAVQEGMVLRFARPRNLAAELEQRLDALRTSGAAPAAVLAFDDMLRRHEAEAAQTGARVSDILARSNAVGFASWGEQSGRLHSSGSFVGLSLRPPQAEAD
ncbi:MAG: FIST N-terminal domain-containing protein [Pseudomonadota bacterium]